MSKQTTLFGAVILRLMILALGIASLFSLRHDVFYYLQGNSPVPLNHSIHQINRYVRVTDLPDLSKVNSFGSANRQAVYYLYGLSSHPDIVVLSSGELNPGPFKYEGRLLSLVKSPYLHYIPSGMFATHQLNSAKILVTQDLPKEHKIQFWLAVVCALFCVFQVARIIYGIKKTPNSPDELTRESSQIVSNEKSAVPD